SNASNYLTNTFNSSISYSRSFFNKQLNFSSAITHSQNTQTRIVYLTAPSINLSMNTLYPFRKKEQEGTLAWYEKISVGYSSTLQNQLQNPDSLFFKNTTLQQMKNGMQHNIPISASFKVMKYFNLTPAINFNERWYIETYKQRFNADSNRIITDTVKGFNAAHEYNGS
ncbi:MAG TPA: kinase, partial [Bacteroidetes bacterium]|nr:kinase [Bacteroidota bacterium]